MTVAFWVFTLCSVWGLSWWFRERCCLTL